MIGRLAGPPRPSHILGVVRSSRPCLSPLFSRAFFALSSSTRPPDRPPLGPALRFTRGILEKRTRPVFTSLSLPSLSLCPFVPCGRPQKTATVLYTTSVSFPSSFSSLSCLCAVRNGGSGPLAHTHTPREDVLFKNLRPQGPLSVSGRGPG